MELGDLASARAEVAVAFERYEQLLAERGYIDHSDQVALALRLLRTRPSVQAEIQRRFRYVLVDELQDTNRAQLELVLAVGGRTGNVMAVGDPDQGIYGFRGARVGNVDRFGTAFGRVKTMRLRRNYRSLAPIIAAAQRVAAVDRPVALSDTQIAHRRGQGKPVAPSRVCHAGRGGRWGRGGDRTTDHSRSTTVRLCCPPSIQLGNRRVRAKPARSRHRRRQRLGQSPDDGASGSCTCRVPARRRGSGQQPGALRPGRGGAVRAGRPGPEQAAQWIAPPEPFVARRPWRRGQCE